MRGSNTTWRNRVTFPGIRPAATQYIPTPTDQLWIGPSARSHAGQLDVSPFPEVLRAQRRHLALVQHHPWELVDLAVTDATRAIHQALRSGTWIPGQQQRLRQLAPGTWTQALASVLAVSPGRPDDRPGHPAVEIAIYPDVVWLAAYSPRTPRR